MEICSENVVDGLSLLQWLVLRYAVLNLEVIQEAIRFAKQEGLSVSLDLASFEVYLRATIKKNLLFSNLLLKYDLWLYKLLSI